MGKAHGLSDAVNYSCCIVVGRAPSCSHMTVTFHLWVRAEPRPSGATGASGNETAFEISEGMFDAETGPGCQCLANPRELPQGKIIS